jgi:hypothetical protein
MRRAHVLRWEFNGVAAGAPPRHENATGRDPLLDDLHTSGGSVGLRAWSLTAI